MIITLTRNDGSILDTIEVEETPCPDIENLDDENLYFENTEGILDAVKDSLKYAKRVL